MGRDAAAATRMARNLTAELTLPVADSIVAFVHQMVGRARPLGVLFYGSALRGGATGEDALEGVLDFYVIVERQSHWPRGLAARIANTILPPNVEFHAATVDGREIRAKVAILTLAQFRARTGRSTIDTTMWARFCQPVRLVWARDAAGADAVLGCVLRSIAVATEWAALLGPVSGTAEQFWQALFTRTYATELRVESANRPAVLLDGQSARYGAMLRDGWRAAGLRFTEAAQGVLEPELDPVQRQNAAGRWARRRAMGRPLNVARLFKAAFTFRGGARYLLWKIARHTGVTVSPSGFEARHPVLGAPTMLLRLWRGGAFRRG